MRPVEAWCALPGQWCCWVVAGGWVTRPRSAIRYATATGKEHGLLITAIDQWMIRELSRWYAMSSAQLVRREWIEQKHLWHPNFGADVDALRRSGVHGAAVLRRTRRLGLLSKVLDNASTGVSPLVASTWLSTHEVAWSATAYGARTAGFGHWMKRANVNPLFMRHAMAAVDIATQLESYEWTIASEREVRRGMLVDGTEVPTQLESVFRSTESKQEVRKSPDLAILDPNRMERYIAVEIERDENRPMRTYTEKLRAYQGNKCIDAVWYLCGSETTAARVRQAHNLVFGQRPVRVRVRVADQTAGFWHIPELQPDDNPGGLWDAELNSDLLALTNRDQRLGITNVGD